MRWRLSTDLETYPRTLPVHFVMIHDLDLPWTHTNMVVVQRCEVGGAMDVWARIPYHHRFQRTYVESSGKDICELIARRCPGLKAEVKDWPQDYHYDSEEIGPSPFPVFSPESRARWSVRRPANVYFDGPEWQENMDWNGRFRRQSEISEALIKWKQEEEHDRPVHAP